MLQDRPSIHSNTRNDQTLLLREHSILSILPAQAKTSRVIHTNADSPSLPSVLPRKRAEEVQNLWTDPTPLFRDRPILSVSPAQTKTSQAIHTITDSPSLTLEMRTQSPEEVQNLWNALCSLFEAPLFAYVKSSGDMLVGKWVTTMEQRPPPVWQPEVERRIDELLELEKNWDSYNAPPTRAC